MPMSKHLPRVASGPLECPYEVRALALDLSRSRILRLLTIEPQGKNVIASSQFNKGSAFTEEERKTFKLHGLLPPNIQTLEEQVQRASQQYKSRPDDLAKNTFMASMKAQNEVLYYNVSFMG
jgi:malate dehydrogenase (oxaloacetate-decarboxylating)